MSNLWRRGNIAESRSVKPLAFVQWRFFANLNSSVLWYKLLCTQSLNQDRVADREVISHLWGRLGVLLQRGNAALLGNRIPALPEARVDGIIWAYHLFRSFSWVYHICALSLTTPICALSLNKHPLIKDREKEIILYRSGAVFQTKKRWLLCKFFIEHLYRCHLNNEMRRYCSWEQYTMGQLVITMTRILQLILATPDISLELSNFLAI